MALEFWNPSSGEAPAWAQDWNSNAFRKLMQDSGFTAPNSSEVGGFSDVKAGGGAAPGLRSAFYDYLAQNGMQIGHESDGQLGRYQVINNQGKPVAQESFDSGGLGFMLSPLLMAAGGPLNGAFGGGAVGGALTGATLGGVNGALGAIDSGGNILTGALKGAATGGALGGIGGSFGTGQGQFDVGGSLGLSDPGLVKFANQAAGTIGKSLVTGQDPTSSLISSGLTAGLGALNAPAATPAGGEMDLSFLGGDSPYSNMDVSKLGLDSIWSGGSLDLNNPFTSGFDFSSLPNMNFGDSTSFWQNGNPQQDFKFDLGAFQDDSGGSGLGALKGLLGSAVGAVGGGSNAAAILGGLLGASQGGKTNETTTQQRMDPRMAQYVYGSGANDPNSYLGAAQKLWSDNKSGINPTMQQGLDMQKAALTDPAYSQGFQQMRNVGTGLLGAQPAGNPFTSGSQMTGLFGGMPQMQAPQMQTQDQMQQYQQMQQPQQMPQTNSQDLQALMTQFQRGRQPNTRPIQSWQGMAPFTPEGYSEPIAARPSFFRGIAQ